MLVRIEVGPVSQASADAWLDYADSVLEVLRSSNSARAPIEVLDAFDDLLDKWRALGTTEAGFHWIEDKPVDEVEYLINALYEAGLAVEAAHAEGRAQLRPPEADEFHYALVNQVLAALEAEGGSEIHLAMILREHWGVASQ